MEVSGQLNFPSGTHGIENWMGPIAGVGEEHFVSAGNRNSAFKIVARRCIPSEGTKLYTFRSSDISMTQISSVRL
jgi:hypothetical protein